MTYFKNTIIRHVLLASAMLASLGAHAQTRDDPLQAGFETPPESAKPRVWWHWLSGNISKDGITKDLEWMKSVGIGGMQMFDGELGAQQIVERPITALSEQWLDALHWTAREADRLGLELTMAAAPGWSETGGPWVRPEQGMKKLVWAHTHVTGGQRFHGVLNRPPVATGAFQGMPARDMFGRLVKSSVPAYYHDVAVLAWPLPEGEVPLDTLRPQLSASTEGLQLERLMDGDLENGIALPAPTIDQPAWVRFSFDRPQTIRALTYVGPVGRRFATGPHGWIEASDDGHAWHVIRTFVGGFPQPGSAAHICFSGHHGAPFPGGF